jgi:serine/threonine protein kinase
MPGKQDDKVIIGHYVLGRTIGQGTFGKVKLGVHALTDSKIAVKVLEKSKIVDPPSIERVTREIDILKMTRHPHIIQLFEIIETSDDVYLIMDYACSGELFDYIVRHQRLAEPQACLFFQQIMDGLEHLHEFFICHRDLKPGRPPIILRESLARCPPAY